MEKNLSALLEDFGFESIHNLKEELIDVLMYENGDDEDGAIETATALSEDYSQAAILDS